MQATLEEFDKNLDGTLDTNIKRLSVYSINYHLRKYVKFDTAEQKWYSENYPDDPSLIIDNDEKNKTKAELVLEIATGNIKKLFVDEYQEPHAPNICQQRTHRDNPDQE